MNVRSKHLFATSAILFVLALPATAQTIWYVHDGATGTSTGLNWTNAFTSLQSALNAAAAGHQIWIAHGVYKPGTNQEDFFQLHAAVEVYGGFFGTPGSEDQFDQRDPDPATNGTVLSGEIGSPTSIWDNCYVIVRGAPSDSEAILDGFTLTRAASHALLLDDHTSHVIRNIRVVDCASSDSGAGTLVEGDSQPTIRYATFTTCMAEAGGGAVFIGNSSPRFEDCSFAQNSTTYGAPAGAVRIIQDEGGASSPRLIRCTFTSNTAEGGAGAVNHEGGFLRLVRCDFVGNQALGASGGALRLYADATVVDCFFAGNCATSSGGAVYLGTLQLRPTFTNCAFSGNGPFPPPSQSCVLRGGAVYNGAGDPKFTNCTFSANQAAYSNGGGGFYRLNGDPALVNCILWGNTANGVADEAAQITGGGSIHQVDFSCVQGLNALAGRTGNIGTNPAFVDADGPDNIVGTADDDLRLQSTSPCLEIGANNLVPVDSLDADADSDLTEPTPDLALVQRILHAPAAGGAAPCASAVVDMGAREFRADCNSNSVFDDLEILQNPALDANGNGILDSCEVTPDYDCNGNNLEDVCDIATGTSRDCYPTGGDGIPDECQIDDCNANCQSDSLDISLSVSQDCNGNNKPDECEMQAEGLWTSNTDFAQGMRINVSCVQNGSGYQLERNPIGQTKPLPYLWVAASARGTILRIAADANPQPGQETTAIVGEYRSAPDAHVVNGNLNQVGSNVSRTTVDLDGSMYASNRDDNTHELGGLVKIGVIVGGQRVDADGNANPLGEYIKDPDYCTCEDRNGDGLIHTSNPLYTAGPNGPRDILPWPGANGTDDFGEVTNAEDECIIRYLRVAGTGARTVSIDKANNLWVGGYPNGIHEVRHGYTGAAIGDPFGESCGGYGGFVDCAGVLWSASGYDGNLFRWDSIPAPPSHCFSSPAYGLAYDPFTGYVWASHDTEHLSKFDVDGTDLTPAYGYDYGASLAQGLAADNVGNLWISHGHAQGDPSRTIGRVDLASGDYLGSVTLPLGAPPENWLPGPTGVAVDANGKVWATLYRTDKVVRIGPDQNDVWGVELTIPIGDADTDGLDPANPYNYGDMGGMVGLQTSRSGTWVVDHDGGVAGTSWCHVVWNEECTGPQPDNTWLEVSVRAADQKSALSLHDYTPVASSGQQLSGVVGRFAQIRVRFFGTCPSENDAWPHLCDLKVVPETSCKKGDVNGDGFVDGGDIQPFVNLILGTANCPQMICPADTLGDGTVGLEDVPCFVSLLLDPQATCPHYAECTEGPHGGRGGGRAQNNDCNSNDIADINDVFFGTSQDCNNNLIPDECDVNPADPDDNGLVSNDLNSNGIPDECEPDCNANGVPDDKDIADQTSNDVNSNGIPDECESDCNNNGIPDSWDISQSTSADCNQNGIPDECEFDCNNNGVPDDCDIDPNDPDGDTIVWADCNTNRLPDACDLAFPPPFGSRDCNDNEIPDECDIANCPSNDPSCQDCNSNGIPDACDIAAQISLDEDEDGIPDECENENRMGGEMMQGESPFGGDPEAYEEAWAAYWDWAIEQDWGPNSQYTGAEQFQRTVDKLQELGLPLSILTR